MLIDIFWQHLLLQSLCHIETFYHLWEIVHYRLKAPADYQISVVKYDFNKQIH